MKKVYNILSIIAFIFVLSIIQVSASINVTLVSPTNDSVATNRSITFNGNLSSNNGEYLVNVSLWTNITGTWALNQSYNITGNQYVNPVLDTAPHLTSSGSDSNYRGPGFIANYNTTLISATLATGDTATEVSLLNNGLSSLATGSPDALGIVSLNYTLVGGTSYYIVAIGSRTSYYTSITYPLKNSSVNWTTGTNQGTADSSFFFDIQNITTANAVGVNVSNFNFTNFNISNTMMWNVQSCTNDSNCSFSIANYTLLTPLVYLNNIIYNATAYETSLQNFIGNFTIFGTNPLINLIYNSNSYPTSVVQDSGGNYIANITPFDIPLSATNNSLYWSVNANGFSQNTTNSTQIINPINLTQCNSGTPYINYTFQDEQTSEVINGTINSLTANYYLGDGNVYKTFSFTNSSSLPSFAFCFSPSNLNIFTNISLSYLSGTSYPQRNTIFNQILTNTTTNQVLNLLSSTSGIYMTFQVLNVGRSPLQGAYAVVYSGNTIIASGYTDSSGGVTFFLNPNQAYTATFSYTGYISTSVSISSGQSSYTIQMQPIGSNNNVSDYTQGISYQIYPNNQVLNSSTIYTFNYSINSTIYTLNGFGFYLYDNNGNLLNSAISTSNGGVVSVNQNTTNLSLIYMNYYYNVNGSYLNFTSSWVVSNLGNTQGSINNFISDFVAYVNVGFFGLDNFGLAIIVFLVDFVATGIVTYKFGFTSPATGVVILFSITAFLDVGLNLMANLNPVGAVPHFPTILMAIIAIGVYMREGAK